MPCMQWLTRFCARARRAPHVLLVFCCVQSCSDETRAAVVRNLGVDVGGPGITDA